MATITKTAVTSITLGDSVDPSIANTPHNDLETNIDDLISYIKSSTVGAFEYNSVTSTGLIFEYESGTYNNRNVPTVIAAGNRSLTASVTSYIEINTSTGAITHNSSAFGAANIPLWEVVTDGSSVTSVTDRRTSFFLRNTLGITDSSTATRLTLSDSAAAFTVPITISGGTVWHSGNDGDTSGLDADLLGGVANASYALLASPALTGTPTAPTAASGTNTTQLATTAFVQATAAGVSARNTILTKDALSQAGSAEGGLSTKIYTGDGTASLAVASGVDMSTGDFGGLVWIKNRDTTDSHILTDTVRGATIRLSSEATDAEVTDADTLLSFSSTGFNVGADLKVNTNTEDYVAWSFQTNKKKTGTTNRNKSYTAHYNTELGFSIVGFVGDGVDGHEYPHHLGKIPELCIFKNRDTAATAWSVKSSLFNNADYLYLNASDSLASAATTLSIMTSETVSLEAWQFNNESASNIISYNFTSIEGISKISKYNGTGQSGNYIDCGFRPAFVMVKNLSDAQHWIIQDSMRGDNYFFASSANGEAATGSNDFDFDDNGFFCTGAHVTTNTTNNEYLFLAIAESSIDGTKAVADYTLPTNADQLAVANPTLITFANGFNSSGNNDAQEEITGATLTYGAGYEDDTYYIYRDKDTSWGSTNVRPLVGLTRDTADRSGVVSPSDPTLRTTAKHSDYESETGTVTASDANGLLYDGFPAFDQNKDNTGTYYSWLVNTTTTSWLQYKYKERRILKSWRLKEAVTQTLSPDRFTIEASDDGYTWTEIDATYKTGTGVAFDTVTAGSHLWCPLQTVANTTAYFYYRINITENNGGATYTEIAELEFNTKITGDYYLIDEAKMYNDAGTRLDRVYVGEMRTDTDGNVTSFINYAAGKQTLNELDVHGKSVFHGDVLGKMFASAWAIIDGTVSPPLLLAGENVKDIVDVAVGKYRLVYETPMDNELVAICGASTGKNYFDTASVEPTSVNYVDFGSVNDVGTYADEAYISIIVFGGKEIK